MLHSILVLMSVFIIIDLGRLIDVSILVHGSSTHSVVACNLNLTQSPLLRKLYKTASIMVATVDSGFFSMKVEGAESISNGEAIFLESFVGCIRIKFTTELFTC